MKDKSEVDKIKYDFVFVVLCYRNTDDLSLFITSAKKITDTYKIVVVNSYYDDETRDNFKKITIENNCDFVNVPNNGYGAGNNSGVDYAKSHYNFEYLVICNPDIEFITFSKDNIKGMNDYIIAPEIKTLKGKSQNPFIDQRSRLINKSIETLEYYGYRTKSKLLLYSGFAINKFIRESSNFIYNMIQPKRRKIHACHGACLIIGQTALRRIDKLYDENMFLFCEEFHLANVAKERKVDTVMVPSLKVLHREDGSVSFISKSAFKIQAKSFIYYYEKWYRSKQLN